MFLSSFFLFQIQKNKKITGGYCIHVDPRKPRWERCVNWSSKHLDTCYTLEETVNFLTNNNKNLGSGGEADRLWVTSTSDCWIWIN